MGGIDKRALARDFEAIEKEVARQVPYFANKSGYIPMVDHTVPPNVSLENYMHFLKVLRRFEPLSNA